MGDYIDALSYNLKWTTDGNNMTTSASRPIYVTSSNTTRDDWSYAYYNDMLEDLKDTVSYYEPPKMSDWITSFISKLNIERGRSEEGREPEMTFDEFMGFEEPEGE